MDTKKLLRILLRDAGELEHLIGEIREAGSFDPLDMELLQSRISGIKHLLEVACDFNIPPALPAESVEKPAPVLISVPEIKAEGVPVIQPDVPKKSKEKKKETVLPGAEKLTSGVDPVSFTGPTVLDVIVQKEPAVLSRAASAVEETLNLPDEHILAEKFVAGKSLNDILLEKSKTEPDKLSILPIKSLASGIGTNERFLFTRELFEGNMDHFNETIHKLDTMGTIQEAITFLSEHFSWGKNETSLRFMELIKRRFTR
jgi:hypothetical protein